MYTIQWQSSTVGTGRRANSTQTTPLVTVSDRSSISNVVPSGTVEARVRFLENHPTTTFTLPRCPTPTSFRGQTSIGFGRRLTSCFAKPASRNEHADEEPRVDIVHSNLGVNSTRSMHREDHGIAGITDGGSDRRTTYSQASGMDAILPLTPKNSIDTMKMDPLREVDGIGNKTFFTGRSLFPTLTSGTGHSDMSRQEMKSRQDATTKSDISALTTSTVRRQSVRDLFDNYGIERPPGLVSDKPGSKQTKSKIRCLNCFWFNHESSGWCEKCKFFLRAIKHEQSYQTLISPKGEEYFLEKNFDEEGPSSPESSGKENLSALQPKRQHDDPKPGPRASQKLKEGLPQVKRPSTLAEKFLYFNMPQSPLKSQVTSRQTRLQELPVAPKVFEGSCTTSIVQESPFLIADRLSSGRSSKTLPATPRMDGIYCRKPRSKLCSIQSKEAADIECKRIACRATHQDHEPYRHSVSCSRLKKHVNEETDNGYAADTSFSKDSSLDHSLGQHKDPSQVSKLYSNWSLKPKKMETSRQTLGSEYIECRGYPRTGHARHGSTNSGAMGQCQHCIDDCQCTACQKTHHSVRCCMNENHQGLIHHHRAPKSFTALTNPLDCPTLSSQDPKPSEKSRPLSPALGASTVIHPASRHKATPPATNISPVQANIQPPSKRSTAKPRKLPTSLRSTFLKEKLKVPTPPPWISDPKIRTKSPATIAISNLRAERATADTLFDKWAEAGPTPLFKERSKLLPPATCDESSPERSVPRADNGSRRASRRFSNLLRFGQKTTIPLLNQKLLEHQEKLRQLEKNCDDRLKSLSEESGKHSLSTRPSVAAVRKLQADVEGKKSEANNRESTISKEAKKNWGLGLVDRRPVPPCPTNASVREHTLSEDCTVDEKGRVICPPTWGESTITVEDHGTADEHDCVWRSRFMAAQNKNKIRRGAECNMPLQGVTVVVHMEGKDDLVIEADLRSGCDVKASGC